MLRRITWRCVASLTMMSAFLTLAGCNTIAGFGQDMSDTGHAIKKAAD